ncbi:energy transducer TonB [uncultured Psychroserpens sp.]|uniref:energy transducer TonB n=1 Tax=uncultured Psychroserpens sp. TaxID=255436 RepID=UPI00262177DC|nr:energy transducer TonB [uncultured Psychroserpens sp.]
MKAKKNPKVDIGRNSSLYFAIGLNLMLLSTYLLFEHKSYKRDVQLNDIVQVDNFIDEDISIVNLNVPPPPPPPPPAMVPQEIKIVEDVVEIEETIIESSEVSQTDIVEYIASEDEVEVEEVEEDIEVPFAVIEDIPVYPGCENGTKAEKKACFQKSIQEHIKKHFKYPQTAMDLGMHGRVHVIFMIDKTGKVTGIKSRGPDKILETEAERIISLLPKMTPGKQRGMAVKVPYSIPISFVLEE